MDAQKYTYQVAWSEEDQEYVATVLEFPSLSWLDESATAAQTGLIALVTDIIADLAANQEEVPVPFGQKQYSGKFNVRTSPSLHRKLAIQAKVEGVSLNTLVNQKLAAL